MVKQSSLWRMVLLMLLITLVTAGCYRQIGDEIQPTLVSQGLPTLTFTPQPTNTPEPSPTISLEETEDVVSLDVIVADIATSTPDPTLIAQDSQPADPFVLTATVLVREITQTAEFSITQTAEALGIGATATSTPTITPEFFVTDAFPTQPANTFVGGTCVHEVLAGENLFRLSLRYGVSINELAQASGVTNIQLITVGQRITIPNCGTTGVLPPPTSVPIATASTFGAAAVPAGSTTTGTTTLNAQSAGSRTHIVQQYETLFEISLLYGIPMQSIANANGIGNSNVIIIGQELVIPAQ